MKNKKSEDCSVAPFDKVLLCIKEIYFNANEEEQKELNDWVMEGEGDENYYVMEDLISASALDTTWYKNDEKRAPPFLIKDTVFEMVCRHMESPDTVTEDDKENFQCWREITPRQQEVLDFLMDPANKEKIEEWKKKYLMK